jgi:hypothetical protein
VLCLYKVHERGLQGQTHKSLQADSTQKAYSSDAYTIRCCDVVNAVRLNCSIVIKYTIRYIEVMADCRRLEQRVLKVSLVTIN